MADYDFIGKGWGFPPTFHKGSFTVGMLSGKADIQSSIEILLSTRLGERVMQPDYGASLERMLFEPLDITLRTSMENIIKKAILYFEPRVLLDNVSLEAIPEEGLVRIHIAYTVAGTNTRENFVFPFYKKEGTNL